MPLFNLAMKRCIPVTLLHPLVSKLLIPFVIAIHFTTLLFCIAPIKA
jgi:hypothetical protein